jgi:hypothetical protein
VDLHLCRSLNLAQDGVLCSQNVVRLSVVRQVLAETSLAVDCSGKFTLATKLTIRTSPGLVRNSLTVLLPCLDAVLNPLFEFQNAVYGTVTPHFHDDLTGLIVLCPPITYIKRKQKVLTSRAKKQ